MSKQTRQYKQLTQGQRYQIEALLGKGHFQKEIAETVGISKSALSRELNRNTREGGYCGQPTLWLSNVEYQRQSSVNPMNDKCLL